MKKIIMMLGLSVLLNTNYAYADKIKFGDVTDNNGAFSISGAVRSAYSYKKFVDAANEGSNNGKFKFLDFKLILNYENPNWLASMDARCYQYDRLCDAIFVRDAWVGYKLSDHALVSVGQQDVDFGFGPLWG